MRFVYFIIVLFPVAGLAQFQVAPVFSSNMVLQRDRPVPVWGKATPGSKVEVRFGNLYRFTIANRDSAWMVKLPGQTTSLQQKNLVISCRDTSVTFQNVLFGDVWLCIGQSNMEWPMMRELFYKEEIKSSRQPLIRFYNPSYAGKNIYGTVFTDSVINRLSPMLFYKGYWQNCDSVSFKTMSAVAYYFGKKITNETGIPVGLVNLAIGGAPLESFIDVYAMKLSRQFSAKVQGDWLKNKALPVWVRERGQINLDEKADVPFDENGKNHAFKPGFAYEAGVAPFLLMPIKGVLCYQGESNAQEAERVNEYADLFRLMVKDYRRQLKQPELPFYFVQISSIDTLRYKGQLWPQFRDAQRKIMQMIPGTGMAVCSDLGSKDDVHPPNKRDVGERLARWALNKTYQLNVVPSGPLPLKAEYKQGKISIRFAYTAKGLKAVDSNWLTGFSVDGINEIKAVVEKANMVTISVKVKPQYVYYGWRSFSHGNLSNSENLPASTFKIKVQ